MSRSSGFEQLPLELRQQIVHEALVGNTDTTVIKVSISKTHGNSKLRCRAFDAIHGLAKVNHSISNDVLDYCFGKFVFCLADKTRSPRFIIREFYRQIGAKNRNIVKQIIIPYFSIQKFLSSTSTHEDYIYEKTALLAVDRFSCRTQASQILSRAHQPRTQLTHIGVPSSSKPYQQGQLGR